MYLRLCIILKGLKTQKAGTMDKCLESWGSMLSAVAAAPHRWHFVLDKRLVRPEVVPDYKIHIQFGWFSKRNKYKMPQLFYTDCIMKYFKIFLHKTFY